jgi:hypothetical protein
MHWARMFSSGRVSPVCLSTPSDHPVQQVSIVRGITHGSALADQIIHQAGHEVLILFKLALRTDLERV